MDVTQFITDMKDDLSEYQEYDTATGSYLRRQALRAAHRIDDAYQWTHTIANTTITATEGTEGPYSLPSDFKGMLREEELTFVYTYDKQSVPIIPDGNYQEKFPVYWQRATNKLYFVLEPAGATYTFYYRKKLALLTDLSSWPQDLEPVMAAFTKHYVLNNSSDTRNDADYALGLAKQLLIETWQSYRKGMSLQESRHPRDIHGNLHGEDWGGIWGQSYGAE